MKGFRNRTGELPMTRALFSFLCLFLCLASALICGKYHADLYAWIVLLPLAFGVCLMAILLPAWWKSGSYTVVIFSFVGLLRYVLYPALLSLFPVAGFSSFRGDPASIQQAILLMAYELVIISIFLGVWCLRARPFTMAEDRVIGLQSGNLILILFVFISFSLILFQPEAFSSFSFFLLKAGTNSRVSSIDVSTSSYLVQQLFHVGRLALFILVVLHCKTRLRQTGRALYVHAALLFTVLNLCVLIGEVRSIQVHFAFSATYLLMVIFPTYRKRIIRVVIISALIVILLMTIYKQFYAFRYDSYKDVFAELSMEAVQFTQMLEVYLLGPQSVASGLKLIDTGDTFNPARLAFDIARSVMGIHFFVKNADIMTTTTLYNLFVTDGRATNGYLLPITAQGYLYFGWILSPIIICIFLATAMILEKVFRTSKSAYVTLFVSYAYIRVATCIVASNINTVLTMGSMLMLSAGSVYFAQKALPIRLIARHKPVGMIGSEAN